MSQMNISSEGSFYERDIVGDKFKYDLEPNSQMVIDTKVDKKVEVILTWGRASINGARLEKNVVYVFGNLLHIPISTWHGATILVTRGRNLSNVTLIEHNTGILETTMDTLLNIHISLEHFRSAGEKKPRTMFLGSYNSGKSSAFETLVNHALNKPGENRKIRLYDLDTISPFIGIPENMGMTIAENPIDVKTGFLKCSKNTISFCHGSLEPDTQYELYRFIVRKLARLMEINKQNYEVMINMPDWRESNNIYKTILLACQWFEVSHIVVFDDNHLYNRLSEDLPPFVKILPTPRTSCSRTIEDSSKLKDKGVETCKEYFYGSFSDPFVPYKIELPMSEMIAYAVRKGGAEERKITKLSILVNSILGAVHIDDEKDGENFHHCSIKSYVCVDRVYTSYQIVQIISPIPKEMLLPCVFLTTTQILSPTIRDTKPFKQSGELTNSQKRTRDTDENENEKSSRHSNEKRTRHTNENEKRTRHTNENEKRTRHTNENEKRTRHTNENEKRTRHTNENEKRTRHTSDNEKRTRHTSDNEKRTRHSNEYEKRTSHSKENEKRT